MIPSLLMGKAHVYGDNVDTDAIIAGKYTKTLNMQIFADHVLEDLDPDFKNKLRPGDILVAGDNFGCGSSREQAPLALKTAGVSAVVAKYFARIFFRNAINIGLPVFEIRGHRIEYGNELEISLENGSVSDLTSKQTYQSVSLPPVMLNILRDGGLVAYLKKNGNYRLDIPQG